MFSGCSSLKKLKIGEDFNITNVTDISYMFYECSNFPDDIQSKSFMGIIDFFKKDN